ncbi:hypothetical protein, partial [Bacillus cereus group sp. BC307]|uniref:hypothetical protein n=1 Tax=Bacillus cereus group sp. BC307 TaxID=3445319 RepID=UPI003F20D13A
TANGNYKHGRNSILYKDMPKKIRGTYREVLADQDLATLTDDLALLKTKMRLLLRDLGEAELPPWGRAVEAFNDYKIASMRDDDADKEAALA